MPVMASSVWGFVRVEDSATRVFSTVLKIRLRVRSFRVFVTSSLDFLMI